jgi:hypothetical protein
MTNSNFAYCDVLDDATHCHRPSSRWSFQPILVDEMWNCESLGSACDASVLEDDSRACRSRSH